MPYKSEKMKIAGTEYDRRRKLTDEQKDQIIALRGTISQRKCAEMFKVSKRTIVFYGIPKNCKQIDSDYKKEEAGEFIIKKKIIENT